MADETALTGLIRILAYEFGDLDLLRQAVTHRSFAHERGNEQPLHNERLEFLGDAVLNLCVASELMDLLPEAAEGQLTKLRAVVVSEASLARVARHIELGEHLLLGRGEAHTGGRDKPSILADTLEAVLGAVFLDGGLQPAAAMVRRVLGETIQEAVEGEVDWDFKGRLQELVQARGQQAPRYEVVAERGPDHEKIFVTAVFLGSEEAARAEGRSKKSSEQRAARRALQILGG